MASTELYTSRDSSVVSHRRGGADVHNNYSVDRPAAVYGHEHLSRSKEGSRLRRQMQHIRVNEKRSSQRKASKHHTFSIENFY